MAPTREKVLSAKEITATVSRYGSEKISTIYVFLSECEVIYFDCKDREWRECSSDQYWDMFESELMMSIMKPLSPADAVGILEKMNAFCQA